MVQKLKRNDRKFGERVRGVARRIAVSAMIIGAVFLLPGKASAGGSIELMAGKKTATTDVKASAQITDKIGLFARGRTTTDLAAHNLSTFGLVDLSLNLAGPVEMVMETQMASGTATPRFGLQYFGVLGDFSIYTLLTASHGATPDIESLTSIMFTPTLTEGVKLLAQIENITNGTLDAHSFSIQRIRMGLSTLDGKLVFGPALDLLEVGKDGTTTQNVGGFVSGKF
ncbi:MAG: hypothetical protein ABII22_06240 [Candidatus Micrarchaeota archaeon]